MDNTFESCEKAFLMRRKLLEQAGWKIKDGKGIWIPTQKGEFLGLVHDLRELKYFSPDTKLKAIVDIGRWLLTQRRVQVRKVASFYGKVAACSLALGPCATMLSRTGHKFIGEESEISWSDYAHVSEDLKNEIKTIINMLPKLNGFPIHQKLGLTPSRVIATDASATELAGLEVRCVTHSSTVSTCSASCADSLIVHRKFSLFELAQSST